MKNILLLTDFSENALNAITYALQFFKDEKCTFFVMHVHKIGSFTTDNLILSQSGSVYDSIVEEPKQKLKILINKLEKEYNNTNHTFETIIDFDVFTDAVNQVVKLKNIALIVLGSNGASGIKEVLFGSNTLNVIRKVNCTTLVIPNEYTSPHSAKEIVLPLNTDVSLNGKSLTKLHKFVKNNNLNLNVLRIKPNNEHSHFGFYDKSNLSSFSYDYFVINNVPIEYAVNSFIQIKGVDLLIILAHKENLFKRIFQGSSASKISNSLQIPLIIFHND